MASVRIGECREEEAIPSRLSRFHERRLAPQHLGTSTYLIAWIDEVPVGHAEIRWNECAAEVSQRFPGCPEINALEVWPARLR
jgi:hypothetical protein